MSISLNDGRQYKLTLKKSKHDPRNYKLSIQHTENQISLPDAFSLKNIADLKILDQGELGSCSANAISQAIQIKTDNKMTISRLFQYVNSRILENTVYEDSGATLLDACKALMRFKYISEDLYPYVISDYTNIPPKELYIFASKNPIKSYQTVEQDLYHIKYCLFFYKQLVRWHE